MSELLAGVDLGGTSIKIAIAEPNGDIIDSTTIPTDAHQGPDVVLSRIGDCVASLMASHSTSSLVGFGMGAPGLVDISQGIVQFLPNLHTQWRGVRAAEYLSNRFACQVRLLNDARVATLGELKFGHGKDAPHLTMVFFAIGTGIGGGVVVDGKLRLGQLGAAGEVGHQTMMSDGPLCGCGNLGCLEAIAGGAALTGEGVRLMKCGLAPELSRLTNGDVSAITPKLLAEAAVEDPAVRKSLTRAAEYIGIAVSNVVTVLHPDLIVLGGGVSEMGPLLFDTVENVVRKRVGMFSTENLRIEKSLLGERAGIAGAVALAIDASLNLNCQTL
jgi:glucokinase